MRAARAADPTYFPAQHDYLMLLWQHAAFAEARQAFATPGVQDGTTGTCLAIVTTSFPTGTLGASGLTGLYEGAMARLEALEWRGAGTPCSATFLSLLAPLTGRSGPQVAEYSRRATHLAPEIADNWSLLAAALWRLGRADEAEAALRAGERRVGHALGRIRLRSAAVRLRLDRGDTAGAWSLVQSLGAAVARDGRPGLRWSYLNLAQTVNSALGVPRSQDAWEAEELELLRRPGAWPQEVWSLSVIGMNRLDRGDPGGALLLHHRQIAIADSVGAPWLQLVAYMRRGRAYAKLGRLGEAERDLRRAIAASADAPDRYHLSETYHNLAHVYEEGGRWADASRAADSFIALARPIHGHTSHLMSLRDAGLIRWKAGWHAAARAAFEQMVRVVDERDEEHYWAGDYFERIGDLPRALAYYRRGSPGIWRPENLRGLAQVYEKLGNLDSAEAAARAHDARAAQWTLLESPLVPGILARRGRMNEAITLSRAWVQRQLAGGNVHGAALARLEVARLLLGSGAPESALVEAAQAESLALSLNLMDELIEARRLKGVAWIQSGEVAAGLEWLQRAAAAARDHPTTDGILTTQVALGDALAALGRRDEALAAYDRAARIVEGVTERLEADLDRVRYRDRHLLPFDGAVRLLLGATPSPLGLDRLVVWGQRRKSAVLALATGPPSDGRPAAAVALTELQRRLGTREALVDFQVLPEAAAALVVTRRHAKLVGLQVAGDSLGYLADRVRTPLTRVSGGRVDLAHAPFDLAIAHLLFRLIWEPLAPHLGPVDRVWIVPDGPLHALPIEALVTKLGASYAGTAYLIDAYEVSYLPTVRFLGHARPGIAGSTRVLAFAQDAPGWEREMDALRSAWPPGRLTVLTGPGATEAVARDPPPDVGVLHFATHAEANDLDPLASHLRLAPSQHHDGYFHVSEVLADRRPMGLVVLSACETVTGRRYAGEGLMGLARAFLASGAGSVIATQWPVGAASADLMRSLYQRLGAGDRPSTALRAAKLDLRHRSATAHPFYWAPFVLIEGRREGGR